MKRLIFTMMVFVLMSSALLADPFTPTIADLAGMTETYDNTNSFNSVGVNVGTYSDLVTPTTYAVGYDAGTETSTFGWASIGIGYDWPPPASMQDLTGYTSYSVDFFNDNDDAWLVNLTMNTGWTDGPDGNPDTLGDNELNKFYQNGWAEILPGQSVTIILDFATEGVINLGHVTNIGFQIGGNFGGAGTYDPSGGDAFHISASPVPLPGAVLLGILGLGVAGIKLRKFA